MSGRGEIIFGVRDDGATVGLTDPEQTKIDIENRINDSIQPKPEYFFRLNRKNKTISLIVEEGQEKPYLYKGKAYRRSDTSSVEVDPIELRRLLLEGSHRNFEELSANDQNLTFNILEMKLQETLGVGKLTTDMLKTLNLYSDKDGYNNAAALLADTNNFPGIDIVKFGENLNVMRERITSKGISVLKQYDEAVTAYRRYYVEEIIEGIQRTIKEKIPENAFREAVANALAHRTWDVNADVHISMFDDRIEIVSIGGLPKGINEDEYLNGGISILRNPILASVLYRMHYIEAFGTGIQRIRMAYQGYMETPLFQVSENSIRITLPVLEAGKKMTTDEKAVYATLLDKSVLTSTEVAAKAGMSRDKTIRLLKSLVEKNLIVKTGRARGTRYHI
ncbi:MAG: putative DNA binding domain-containing protein [Eubacterium sp.]|nr:putative DNA binding domain-containing protein [Eubacterium sp.]